MNARKKFLFKVFCIKVKIGFKFSKKDFLLEYLFYFKRFPIYHHGYYQVGN